MTACIYNSQCTASDSESHFSYCNIEHVPITTMVNSPSLTHNVQHCARNVGSQCDASHTITLYINVLWLAMFLAMHTNIKMSICPSSIIDQPMVLLSVWVHCMWYHYIHSSAFISLCAVHGFASASYDVIEDTNLAITFFLNVKGNTTFQFPDLFGRITSQAGGTSRKSLPHDLDIECGMFLKYYFLYCPNILSCFI